MPIGSFGYNAGEISYTWAESQVTNRAVTWKILNKTWKLYLFETNWIPGGCGRACLGRLCSCQPVLWPECCWKQVCVIIVLVPENCHLEFLSPDWSPHLNILLPPYSSYIFRSIATIRLVFARTIGYYFLRTYFPLIIIVFWWDKLHFCYTSSQWMFPDVKYLFQFLHFFLAG